MKTIRIILATLVFVCFASCSKPDGVVRTSNFTDIGELSVLNYKVSHLIGVRDSTVWTFLGEKEILFRIDADIEVGIDTHDIDVNDSTVLIPHCRVLSCNIQQDHIECLYKKVSGVCSDFSDSEIISIQQEGERSLMKNIDKYPILTDGDVVLIRLLKNYFNNYNLQFK